MSEIILLRKAFIDFLQQMLPLVIDPMMIVQRHFDNFIKILGDNNQTLQQIVAFIEKFKIKPSPKKTGNPAFATAEPNSISFNTNIDLIPPSSAHKEPPPKQSRYHRRCTSNQQDIFGIQKRQATECINVKMEQPEQLQINENESPQVISHFHKFLQIQQSSGFSVIQKEYILDNLECGIKEFRRNTKTLLCLAARSSEVNTSESNEIDLSVQKTDYTFTTYTEKLSENQKSQTRQIHYPKEYNILNKYKFQMKRIESKQNL